jgi:hypothetical protein
LDDDIKKGLIPSELDSIGGVSEKFGDLVSERNGSKTKTELEAVDLPPFTKQALLNILQNELP